MHLERAISWLIGKSSVFQSVIAGQPYARENFKEWAVDD